MVALVATGCGFEVTNTPGDGGTHDGATMGCPWPYAPSGVDPCSGVPAGVLPELDLSAVGVYVYDCDDATLTTPTGADLVAPSTLVGGARVIWSGSFKVGPAATLRVTGDIPLVVVAQSTVTIDGTVDAGSYLLGANRVGAGSNPAVCATATLFGTTCTHGGSGGGGGGFGTVGAPGGVGGLTNDCGMGGSAGIPGGPGGPASADLSVRGGCAGGDGAEGDGSLGGDGGEGGGAIQLVARDVLRVGSTGKILAGGGGGTGGNNGRSGGGGGGSGGSILLGGTSITVAGVIAANGAGGGGGSNGNQAGGGADGQPSLTAAVGGTPEGMSGTGGNGAAGALPATPGTGLDRGGGGGGGGAGKIRLTTKPGNAPVIAGAVITPAPT